MAGMDYRYDINIIKKSFAELDSTIVETIQEANEVALQYEIVMNELINILYDLLENKGTDKNTKETIYNQAVTLLANYIGCAVDAEKYGNIINELFNKNKITRKQFDQFIENLNLGRWN